MHVHRTDARDTSSTFLGIRRVAPTQGENSSVARDDSGSLATFSLLAVIVVVALIALFVWQPWNATTTSRSNTNTTIQQSGGASSTNGTSTTTTTTSGGTQ